MFSKWFTKIKSLKYRITIACITKLNRKIFIQRISFGFLYIHLQDRDNVHLNLAQLPFGQLYPMKLHDPEIDFDLNEKYKLIYHFKTEHLFHSKKSLFAT